MGPIEYGNIGKSVCLSFPIASPGKAVRIDHVYTTEQAIDLARDERRLGEFISCRYNTDLMVIPERGGKTCRMDAGIC